MTLRHGELDDSPDPWTFLRLSVHAESVIQRREVISFSVSSDAGAGCVGTSLCSMGAGDSSAGSFLGSLAVGASSTGRVRGSGSSGAPRRWLVPVPVRWCSQVIKSCAVPDWVAVPRAAGLVALDRLFTIPTALNPAS
jgi:hypothetical protein